MTEILPENIRDYCQIPFNFLCKTFEEISKQPYHNKIKLFEKFVTKYCLPNLETPVNIQPIIRIMLCHLDRERPSYNMKEMQLSKYISEVFTLPKVEEDRLKYFKDPSFQVRPDITGDYPQILYHILEQNRCKNDATLLVHHINQYLDLISEAAGEQKKVHLSKLFSQATALEMKQIVKLILKEVKIGIKHDALFKSFNKNSISIFNATSNLRIAIEKPIFENVDEIQFSRDIQKIFQPMRPMLASRKSYDQINSLFLDKRFTIETKQDGERIQIHIKGNEIRLQSRNGFDTSSIYLNQTSQLIKENINAEEAILDGEIIVQDYSIGKFVPFGNNKAVALQNKDGNNEDSRRLCIKLFDIMYIKHSGESVFLLEQPLHKRREILSRILTPIENKIDMVQIKDTDNLLDIQDELDKAIERREEGIIIKQLETGYDCGLRNDSWIKLKVDLFDGIGDTLDLQIIGGQLGKADWRTEGGDETDHITSYLVAIVDKENQSQEKTQFIPFCSVISGMNRELYSIVRSRMEGNWVKYDPNNYPKNLMAWKPPSLNKPDFMVRNLKNSIVMEIKAQEILPTQGWPLNQTLRFARIVSLRLDKSFDGVLDKKGLDSMIENQNKSTQRMGGGEDKRFEQKAKAPKINEKRAKDKTMFMDQFYFDKSVKCEQMNNAMKNLTCCVMINDERKGQIERKIKEMSGNVIANAVKNNIDYIIADRMDFRVKSALQNTQVAAIKPEWIDSCYHMGSRVHLSSYYLLSASEDHRMALEQNCDRFNDHYQQYLDEKSIDHLLDNMNDNQEYIELVGNKLGINLNINNPKFKFENYESGNNLFETLDLRFQENRFNIDKFDQYNNKMFYILQDDRFQKQRDLEYEQTLSEMVINLIGGSVKKNFSSKIDFFVYFDGLISTDLIEKQESKGLKLISISKIMKILEKIEKSEIKNEF